jgi:alpha-tubulin suppressor-like RCC1 family protein
VSEIRNILSHRIRFFFPECGDIYCWGWNESGQLGLPCKTVKEKRQTVSKQNELHKMFHADMDKEQESVLQISNEESAYESKWQIFHPQQ